MKITNSEHNPVPQSLSGFTCPPTIYFKFITKCDKCYYKVRQVSQSVTILLQSATGITKCDDYYKVRQYSVTKQAQLYYNNNYCLIIIIIIIIIIVIIIIIIIIIGFLL